MKSPKASNATPESIAIAGAGLLGRLLAWKLQTAGCKVTLFEAGNFYSPDEKNRAAAFTAAGMIAPLSEAVVSDASVYRMGQYALDVWPQWIKDLGSPSPLFFKHGSLVIAHPQDESELIQFERELNFVISEKENYQTLDQTALHKLEPDLHTHFHRGLFLEAEGHLHNRELLEILARKIQELGVNVFENTQVQVEAYKIITETNTLNFDRVIDCRGLGAKSQSQLLRGVRGETLHVETKEIKLNRPVRLMHPRYQLYVVPKPDHRFVIGATQIESEDKSPMSLQSSLELSSALYTLSPAFAEARILEMDVNLRPAFSDNLPRIKIEPGLISANGLFRHGYLLAPAMVDALLDNILNRKASHNFSEYLMKND